MSDIPTPETVDSMYAKMVSVALECNPIPAKSRADGKLEPPWEVFARVKRERDRLAEAIKSAGMLYVPNSGGPYQTGWKDAVNWINQQALAAVEGGSDE